jgi:hypothetical protein
MGLIMNEDDFRTWLDMSEPGDERVYFSGDLTKASSVGQPEAEELGKLIDFAVSAKNRKLITLRQLALPERGEFEHIAVRI